MYKGGGNQKIQNLGLLILLLLAGVVIGGFIGQYLGALPYLSWLNYGNDFGLTTPLVLDLGILKVQFALSIRFTIAGIIGIIIAVFAYRKM